MAKKIGLQSWMSRISIFGSYIETSNRPNLRKLLERVHLRIAHKVGDTYFLILNSRELEGCEGDLEKFKAVLALKIDGDRSLGVFNCHSL